MNELKARLAAPRSKGDVQKIGGWYSVYLPRDSIKFPFLCPRCLRSNPERNIRFSTEIEKKRWFIGKTRKAIAVEVPHCADCARSLLRDRKIASIGGVLFTIGALVLAVILDLPRPLFLVLLLVILWPVIALYSRIPTVKLGDCSETIFELKFKKAEYAAAFAAINDVTAQNADTIEDELTDAIQTVREAGLRT